MSKKIFIVFLIMILFGSFKNNVFLKVSAKEINAEKNEDFYYQKKILSIEKIPGWNFDSLKANRIYTLYDELIRSYNAGKAFKKKLGNDSSNSLPIYSYEFKPKIYTKKIIIGSGIHGNGIGGDPNENVIALYLFMNEMIKESQNNTKLSELLSNTWFIIIPLENPWGFDNNKRVNANGVDINRNFEYKWSSYPEYNKGHNHYKGKKPFSEKETQYIRDILYNNPDSNAYIDFHVWYDTTQFKYVYSNNTFSKMNEILNNISKYLAEKNNTTYFSDYSYDTQPVSFNYAEKVLNIPSANPEYIVKTTDQPQRNSESITKMVEWYGNIIYFSSLSSLVNDTLKPVMPIVNEVYDNSKEIIGDAENAAKVYAYVESKKLGEAKTREKKYNINIPKQKAGTLISIYTMDRAGNKSDTKTIKVIDKTAPSIPSVNTVSDKSTTITGKAESGAKVYAYVGKKKLSETIAKNGSYSTKISKQKAGTSISVYAIDPAKNKSGSKTIKVVDKTAPAAPTVNKVTSKSTTVSGKGEKAATVLIYNGSKKIGQGTVDSKGNFKVKIKAQKKGSSLKFYVQDKAGNKSGGKILKVS